MLFISMRKNILSLSGLQILIIFAALSVMMISCDSGGGGGGSTGLSYTGSTSQATLNTANSQEVASTAYEGGQFGSTIGGGFSGVNGEYVAETSGNFLFGTLRAVQSATHQIDFNLIPSYASATTTETATIEGGCGGSANYEISVDETSGDFSGSMTFNAFCEGGMVLSGSASFTGSFDSNQEPEIVQFSFDMMSVSGNGEQATMDGTLSMDLTSSPINVTMEMLIRDASGKTFWVNNYVWAIADQTTYVSVEINGRFYHTDYGFVDLTTESALVIDNDQMWPRSGTIIIEGADNTEAKLIALNQTECEVTGDFDGDTVYEYSTGPMLWENL